MLVRANWVRIHSVIHMEVLVPMWLVARDVMGRGYVEGT